MKYELISAKRLLDPTTYEITIKAIPERLIEYLQPRKETKYHVRKQNEWYIIPAYTRCPQNIETHLQPIYHQAEHLTNQEVLLTSPKLK